MVADVREWWWLIDGSEGKRNEGLFIRCQKLIDLYQDPHYGFIGFQCVIFSF
jgi:hypothetical protein